MGSGRNAVPIVLSFGRLPVPAQCLRQPLGLRTVRRIEMVAAGKDFQVEIWKEDTRQPCRNLPEVIWMAEAAKGKEHRLGEGGQP